MKLIAGKQNVIYTLVKPGYAEVARQPKYRAPKKVAKPKKVIRRDFNVALIGLKKVA